MAGDVVEVSATVTRVGTRSRDLELVARVVARAGSGATASAADVLEPALIAVTARGTVVVPSVASTT
jgi:3-aminobutyryl-CoA ammonia-lyase